MDLVKWLNQNSGAVIAVATVVYALITLALLFEARANRSETKAAGVVASPEPWERGGMYVAVIFANYGPAVARNAEIEVWETEGKTVIGQRLKWREPYMPPSRRRTILPDKTNPAGMRKLEDLATADVILNVKYSWDDDLRRWGLLRRRHEEMATYRYDELKPAFHRGGVLAERSPQGLVERIGDELSDLNDKLDQTIAKLGP